MTPRHIDSSSVAPRSRLETAAIKATVLVLFVAIVLGLGNSIAVLALQLVFLFILTLFVVKDAAIKNFQINYSYGCLALVLSVTAVSVIASFTSFSDSTYATGIQLKFAMTFASTIYIIWIFYHCLNNGIVDSQYVIKSAIYALVIYSVVKIIIDVFVAFEIIQTQLLFTTVRQTLGAAFISTGIVFGLIRINLPPDFGIPIVLFCTLAAPKLGVRISKLFQIIAIILLMIAVLIAYSRYLWAVTFLAVLFATLIMGRRLFFALAIIATIVVGAAASNQAIVDAVEERFFSYSVEHSDNIRINQQHALTEAIVEDPLLGKGLATYVSRLVRSKNSPYSYELQIMATAMQYGLIGIIPILLFMASFISLVRSRDALVCSAIYVTYLFWLMAGFTNPSLIGRAAAMVFVVFICVARLSPQLEAHSTRTRIKGTPVHGTN
ncbi:O-antigen ligase family protein [Inquilinus sp. NPDC058860]|uniref:O-antigen ligase family protein n=1 Tax=Inquilinus sp. NPDC058860 TaxID=3346652 RepID=UPI0036A67238